MIPALPRAMVMRLVLIRSALLAGVLLFGAVTWYLKGQGRTPELSPDKARQYTYVFIALCTMALGGLLVVRSRLTRAPDAGTQMSMYLIGYAMAESAALFGAVAWYVGGQQYLCVAGLILMVAAFQVLPLRRGSV